MKKLGLLFTLCAFFVCAVAFAQSPKEFVHKAGMAGTKEVKAGELAEKKAVNARVKAFGTRMVHDHTRANDELMGIAKRKGYSAELPAPGSVTDDPMLTKASGAEFDRMYVTMMLSDHKEAVSLFESAAKNNSDPDIKSFARKTLPTLKQHLASIKSIAASMHIKGSTM